MKFKNFKSIDNTEKYVSLLSGHTFRIGKEWTKIPELAWQDCYAHGCMSEDMIGTGVEGTPQNKEESDHEVIRNIMLKWYEENNIEKFDKKSGRPNIMKLREESGIRHIDSHLRNKIWFALQEELR